MSVYVLFVLVLADGVEREWKSFSTFEQCWEVATLIVKDRPNITARCVLVEKE
jgi:hypothetical protein